MARSKEMKGIYRQKTYWDVRITRNHKLYLKTFPDLKYGSKEKAKVAAIAYRDELFEQVMAIPKDTPKRRVVSTDSNNKTGELGVSRTIKTGPNGTKHECYTATWSSQETGRRFASFAVPKYGEEKAFKMAVEHRRKMMRDIHGPNFYKKLSKQKKARAA